MKTLDQIRGAIRKRERKLAERYGIKVVGIYGSYVRGEARRGSDVDLLADPIRPISLFELVGAELYLRRALGVKVDLVLKRNVREELRERIYGEVVAV